MGRGKNQPTQQQPAPAITGDSRADLQAAIEAGIVVRERDRVVVPAKFSPNGTELIGPYDRFSVSERVTDPEQFVRAALAICGGNVDQAKKLFNTAWETATRTPIRHRLVKQAKGAQPTLDKMAKLSIKAGLAKTVEEAREKLKETFKVQ